MMIATQGPECPECGCGDGQDLGAATRWGKPRTKRQCGYCGHVWYARSADPPPPDEASPAGTSSPEPAIAAAGVVYPPKLACPKCGSANVKCTSSPTASERSTARVRYHVCIDCAHRFKSVERLQPKEKEVR